MRFLVPESIKRISVIKIIWPTTLRRTVITVTKERFWIRLQRKTRKQKADMYRQRQSIAAKTAKIVQWRVNVFEETIGKRKKPIELRLFKYPENLTDREKRVWSGSQVNRESYCESIVVFKQKVVLQTWNGIGAFEDSFAGELTMYSQNAHFWQFPTTLGNYTTRYKTEQPEHICIA